MSSYQRFKWYLHRQPEYVSWLPYSIPSGDELIFSLATWSDDGKKSAVELMSLSNYDVWNSMEEFSFRKPDLRILVSWKILSRVTSHQVAAIGDNSLVASGTYRGDLYCHVVQNSQLHSGQRNGDELDNVECVRLSSLHDGSVVALDIREDTQQCITAGLDGKICATNLGGNTVEKMVLVDKFKKLSFSALKWTSSAQFVSASTGPGLQIWDTRALLKPACNVIVPWEKSAEPQTIHSIDVHPSQQHICAIGGSNGLVMVWDLRRPTQPEFLSGKASSMNDSPFSGEVWKLKFDGLQNPLLYHGGSLPILACSDDGLLTATRAGHFEEIALENCAINTFDVDSETGQVWDIV